MGRSFFDQYASVLWILLTILAIGILVWLFLVHRRAKELEARFDHLLGGITGDNVPAMLAEYLQTVRATSSEVGQMKTEYDQIARVMPSVVRHVGLVRFSPFHDTGGDQSFALALLDSKRDGVIVTALHSRSDSRLYAKPVESGHSPYSLTPEEQEAMERAVRGSAVSASA